MTIQVGDKVPAATFKVKGPDGLMDVSSDELFGGKTIALFSVPGAYTPTCTAKHVPSYRDNADALKAKGVDEIICISVNDPFVMAAWGDSLHAEGKVRMVGDWNASFTKALGLEFDASGAGLGARGKRFSMLVKDGKVASLHVEEAPGEMAVSDAGTMLNDL
ncbi:MAG: peroxiredoxin [Alphaproteobacteria bacterium]